MNSGQRRASDNSGASTKLDLIEAARRLLATEGAEGLTSRAIAAAADANLASITYYFGSKEQLVIEAMVSNARELLAPVVGKLRSEGDPVANMLEAVLLLNRMVREHDDSLVAYVQALARASTDPSVASPLRAFHRDIEQLLAEQIDAQRSAGQLPNWVSSADMARLVVAVIHGTLVTSQVDPERVDEAAIGTQFAQLLLEARTSVNG